MNIFFLFTTVTMKSEKLVFFLFLLFIDTNFFNTIMHLIIPNYVWKNKVKRIKTIQ